MKKFFSISTIICCLLALFLLSGCSMDGKEYPSLSVEISKGDSAREIHAYWNDDTCYLYLPSYCSALESRSGLQDITIAFNGSRALSIDGTDIDSYTSLPNQGTHTLTVRGNSYDLLVYYSSGVGTIFIDTESGNMDAIYADDTYKEESAITVYDPQGNLDYASSKDKLKIRGNSTATKKKKPFTMQLDKRASILGLPVSKKYVLLSNAYDRSALRDVLYKELAADMDFSYAASTTYADVYLNGEYNGMYVLSEKYAPEEGRPDLGADSFLCSIELSDNLKEGDTTVDSLIQDVFLIEYPTALNHAQLKDIENILQRFERALLADDGIDPKTGLSLYEMIDFDSFAKGYIIDEVCANADASLASSYLYYNAQDGLLYKGPVWDGDRTFGNQRANSNPKALSTASGHGLKMQLTTYYALLLEKEEFLDAVYDIYESYDFKSILNSHINDLEDKIKTAKVMDDARWGTGYSKIEEIYETQVSTADDLKNYIDKRIDFLDRVFDGHFNDYATVYIFVGESDVNYYYETVKKGTIFTHEDPSLTYINIDTGETVDFTDPVTENIAVRTE